MTSEEVKKFAEKITYGNTKTEITLTNGQIIRGHFDKNHDAEMMKQNQWNFVVLPQKNPELKKTTLFNGDDFISIQILKV